MRTGIIAVLLSISLLAATARASQHVEKDSKNQEQAGTAQDASASTPTPAQLKEEKRVREIKNRVRQMGLARRITVVLLNDNERYGSIELIGDESFQLAEIDTKQEVKVHYKDVKKVRTGYGKFNAITGKRINPKWDLITGIALIAFIIIIVPLSVPRT